MRLKRPFRGPSLLEIHKAHYRNYGALLPVHEDHPYEEDAEDAERVIAWQRSVAPSCPGSREETGER